MADVPGRIYKIAKAYLDAARGRLEDIDAQAQAELSRSLNHEDLIPAPPPASSSDPMERARLKIAAAQQAAAARGQTDSGPATGRPDPVQTAFKVIGVPVGSDYVTVQQAVARLRERCAPERFPEGSDARAEAQVILTRVDEAAQVLQRALEPPKLEGRFDKLEF